MRKSIKSRLDFARKFSNQVTGMREGLYFLTFATASLTYLRKFAQITVYGRNYYICVEK